MRRHRQAAISGTFGASAPAPKGFWWKSRKDGFAADPRVTDWDFVEIDQPENFEPWFPGWDQPDEGGANDNGRCAWSESPWEWKGARRVASLDELIQAAPWTEHPLCFAAANLDFEKAVRDLQSAFRAAGFEGCAFRNDSHENGEGQFHVDGVTWASPPACAVEYFPAAGDGAFGPQFLSAFEVMAQLDSQWLAALEHGVFRFKGGPGEPQWRGPLLSRNVWGKWIFRWRDDVEAVNGENAWGAVERVRALIAGLSFMRFRPLEGDFTVWPNWTWMHRHPQGASSWRAWIG